MSSSSSRNEPTLLPCPMCGKEAFIGTNVVNRQVDDHGTYKSMTGYSVNCIWCGVNNRSIAEGYATPELAAERWNKRASLSEKAEQQSEAVSFVRQIYDAPNWARSLELKEQAETLLTKLGVMAPNRQKADR